MNRGIATTTTKNRVPLSDALLTHAERDVGPLVPIQKGRKMVEQDVRTVRVHGLSVGPDLLLKLGRVHSNLTLREWNDAYSGLLARCTSGLSIEEIDDLALADRLMASRNGKSS